MFVIDYDLLKGLSKAKVRLSNLIVLNRAKFDLVFIYNTLIDLKNCDTRLMDNYITVALHGNSVIWYRNRKTLTQPNCGGKITSFQR